MKCILLKYDELAAMKQYAPFWVAAPRLRLHLQDSSPLLAAASAGQGSAVGALLSGGALPDAPDVTGVTALMAAAGQGHLDCMDVLLGFDAGKAGFCITTVKHLHALHCVQI